jgi:hypothetical protein
VTYNDRRPPATRFRHIRPHLTGRVLDFGAAEGWWSIQAAGLGCQVVAVEPDRLPTDLPADVQPVRRRLEGDQLREFGRFDVTLALSILHHLDDWRGTLDVLTDITWGPTFVELAHPDEQGVAGTREARQEAWDLLAGLTPLCRTRGWDTSRMRPLYRIN